MGFADFFTGVFQGFMDITPKPIKFIIFLFFCLFIGNFITALGLSTFYDCSSGAPYQYNGNKFKCDVMQYQLLHCKAEAIMTITNSSTTMFFFDDLAFSLTNLITGGSAVQQSLPSSLFSVSGLLKIPARIASWTMSLGDTFTRDPCMMTLNSTDTDTWITTPTYYNVTNFNQMDILNYCGATLSAEYTNNRRDFISIGCVDTDPAILIGEKINPLSYKLWIILMLIGTAGFYAFNSWKEIK